MQVDKNKREEVTLDKNMADRKTGTPVGTEQNRDYAETYPNTAKPVYQTCSTVLKDHVSLVYPGIHFFLTAN